MLDIKKIYYQNGQLKYEDHYVNDQPHGICKGWYKDGSKMHEWSYKNGQRHGIDKEWDTCEIMSTEYCLYGELITEKEYHRHRLIEQMAGIE